MVGVTRRGPVTLVVRRQEHAHGKGFPMTRELNVLTLFFADVALGIATNLSFDQPWVHADFTLFDAALPFHRFFDACTDEDQPLPEPGGEFPDEYFDDGQWYVVTRGGERRNIWLPAVHRDANSISWRWR